MRLPWIAGAAVLALVLLAAPAAAQDDPASSCSDSDEATSWWLGQKSRVHDRGSPEIQIFWDAVLPQLQTGAISDPSDLCTFLDLVLRTGTDTPAQDVDRIVRASKIADGFSAGHKPLAKAVLYAVGQEVGQTLEKRAKEGPIDRLQNTPERIQYLERIKRLYEAVGLDGALARIELWLEAERQTWNRDTARVERHLQQAERAVSLADSPVWSGVALGRIPALHASLATDKRIMQSHGASDRVEEIETMQSRLESARTTALQQTLVTTGVLVGLASLVFLGIRIPLSWFERDLEEVETMLRGVPR